MGAELQLKDLSITSEDIKRYIAPNASDKELYVFLNTCKSYGLNPMKREVYFVKYGQSPGQTIVGYESYIKRAERTGLLDGWEVKISKDELGDKAVLSIWRKDRSRPFVWEVYRDEFDTGMSNWKKMWKFMLKKVAISQGFRLCFSEDLGGMPYIPEEINGGSSEKLAENQIIEAEIAEEKRHDEDRECQEAIEAIEACSTLDELKVCWKSIQKLAKKCPELSKAKDDRKSALDREANLKAAKPVEPTGEAQRECPESGDMIYESYCNDECKSREGCPAWD